MIPGTGSGAGEALDLLGQLVDLLGKGKVQA